MKRNLIIEKSEARRLLTGQQPAEIGLATQVLNEAPMPTALGSDGHFLSTDHEQYLPNFASPKTAIGTVNSPIQMPVTSS